MSKSTHPNDMMTNETPFAAMAGDIAELQKEAIEKMANAPQFAGVANLAAHPMGAMAAASALSMGMASQMFGIFAGTMAGAMRATNMLANETTGGHSSLYGLSNPLNFDLATGSFDDTKEPDKVAVKKPAPRKAAAPEKAAPKKNSTAKAAAKKAEPVALVPAAPKAAVKNAGAKGEIAAVMPEDFVKPKPAKKPGKPDDLKAISGVGPKLEEVLNGLGIWTYAQIAAWTPVEIAWVDDYLQFRGRIERDGWVAQAAELAKKA